MGVDILKKSNEVGQCPESYQSEGFCHSYFFEKFNEYPSVLRIEHKDYLKHISDFHDPILTYVALYFYHNYKIAKEYFKPKGNGSNPVVNKSYGKDYNTACAVLNRWLDQQKNFYTDFGKCSYNRRWWNIYIEPLLKELEKYYPGKTCERFYPYYDPSKKLEYQKENDKSYQLMPEDNVCYKNVTDTETNLQDDDKKSLEDNCAKLSIIFYLGEKYKLFGKNTEATSATRNNYCNKSPPEKINYNPVLKAEKSYFCESLLNKIALPIIVTILGTIFLAFFLSEFTPIGSIFGSPSKNKVRLREQFNEEAAYDEYKTYRNNNQNTAREKNIIYYQSMNG